MRYGRRYLRSRKAISGAVTALILVIVSVALALAVAVFAFGLFGSFGSSGNLQVVGTTYTKYAGNQVIVNMTVKNPSSNPASINAITVGNYTTSKFYLYLNGKLQTSAEIPAGFSGQIGIAFQNTTAVPGFTTTNVGGTVPVTLAITEGTLSPTITVNAVLQSV
ncbi:hypothetical protein L3N51_02305 [Metallosphaera sp. J1]|nr:hypothetical protein [Metallosphaera javensis (ex Hofmann et al. 2022)]